MRKISKCVWIPSDMRLRPYILTACAVVNTMLSMAHAFSGTVRFEGSVEKGIILQAEGTADKAKEAREEAVRNAFKALFYEGVEGLTGGVPLLAERNKSFDYRFFDSQYQNFLLSAPEVVGENKKDGQRSATMTIAVNIEKLKKTAAAGGCVISPQWKNAVGNDASATSTPAVRPSIVVIPYMADSNADFEAMVECMKDDDIARSAVNAVSAHFGKMGYPTKDFATVLQNSITGSLISSGAQTDVMTETVRQLPGDIIVTVKASVDTKGESSNCSLNLKAVERHTGEQLALQDFTSGRYRNADPARLVAHAVDMMPDDFFSRLDRSFSSRLEEGLAMIVEFQLGETVSDWNFDAPVPSSGDDFKTWLGTWMRQHARGNSYVRTAATDKYIRNSIRIPLLKPGESHSSGPDAFASDLRSAVRDALDDEYGVKVTEMGQRLIVTIE